MPSGNLTKSSGMISQGCSATGLSPSPKWKSPKVGVPPNHPSLSTIFVSKPMVLVIPHFKTSNTFRKLLIRKNTLQTLCLRETYKPNQTVLVISKRIIERHGKTFFHTHLVPLNRQCPPLSTHFHPPSIPFWSHPGSSTRREILFVSQRCVYVSTWS